MYRDPACHPWTSRQWCPPGYASRRDAEMEQHEKAGMTPAQFDEKVQNQDARTSTGGTTARDSTSVHQQSDMKTAP